jgi:hypothetical protein
MLAKASLVAMSVVGALAFVDPGVAGSRDQLADRLCAPYSPAHREPVLLAAAKNPKCAACERALDACSRNPPYGNERICASDYYDCIRKARANCS